MLNKADDNKALHGHLTTLGFSALVARSFSLGALIIREISPLALTAFRFAPGLNN